MGRKAGPDLEKLKKIRQILNKNPDGLWIREIARKASLDKSTVSLYLAKHMTNEIEDIFISDNKWIRIVRLRNEKHT